MISLPSFSWTENNLFPSNKLKKAAGWFAFFLSTGFLLWLTIPHPWLAERLRSTPTAFTAFWLILACPALVSSRYANGGWRFLLRGLRRVYRLLASRPYAFSLWTCLGCAYLFWFLRIEHRESGDLYHFMTVAQQGRALVVPHAPLESVIRCWLSEILRIYPQADLIILLKGLSCLYGGLYVLTVLILCSRLPKPYTWFGPLFLIATPVVQLYCGYMEIYGLPLLIQLLFLLTGLLFVCQRASFATVSFCFGLAMAVAFWHNFLLPGYLYLAWLAWRQRGLQLRKLCIYFLLACVPIVSSLAFLSYYTNPFLGFFSRIGNINLLIPFSPEANAAGYTLFGRKHLADFSSQIVLIAFPAAVFVLTRCLGDVRTVGRLLRKADFIFLFVSGCGAASLGFLYYPLLGFPLDWDLYTFMFPSMTLLGVTMMRDVLFSRRWKKMVLVLVLGSMALASAWILQNALFWHYPFLIKKLGPAVSIVVPDFYYRQMQKAFERHNEADLYWMAGRALGESPEKYKEILEVMNEWTISAIAKNPPQEFDDPGWACDLALRPDTPEWVVLFDRHARIFMDNGQTLKWIFAPPEPVDSPVVAGDVTDNGDAVLLTRRGDLLRVSASALESGLAGAVVWSAPEWIGAFLPHPPSGSRLPVHMVDIGIKGDDGHICVLDNYNRVWDTVTKELLLQGILSYNTVKAFHFTQTHQPVTIDIYNRLSYDPGKAELSFQADLFYPIVRDFSFVNDDGGIVIIDLNGIFHYTGTVPFYENVSSTSFLLDRYNRIIPVPRRNAMLVLDNRYRLQFARKDVSSQSLRSRIRALIDGGHLSQVYKHLRLLWQRESLLTPLCYELVNTDFIRAARGITLQKPHDAIPMFADVFALDEDFFVLLDRWGRLVYEIKGNRYLLDGTGITVWPHREAIDGALTGSLLLFLCADGTVWQYHLPLAAGRNDSPFNGSPELWGDLHDYQENVTWIGIETDGGGENLIAMTADGLMARIGLDDSSRFEKINIPVEERELFDFAFREDENGFTVACSSTIGPVYLYSEGDREARELPDTNYGWQAIADIRFSQGNNVLILDRFGVIHQRGFLIQFSEAPSTPIIDAAALRFTPSRKKALWLRSNGDLRVLRLNYVK